MTQSQLIIRPRRPEDDAEVARVVATAFGGEMEAALVNALRDDGDMALELVAEKDAAIVGHIAFSRLEVHNGSQTLRATALAPLAVAPSFQGRSVGSDLTRAALAMLRAQGEDLALVLGHPNYYPRFGFSALVAKLLDAPYSGNSFMALELRPAALQSLRWTVSYPPAFAPRRDIR